MKAVSDHEIGRLISAGEIIVERPMPIERAILDPITRDEAIILMNHNDPLVARIAGDYAAALDRLDRLREQAEDVDALLSLGEQ